VLRAAGETETTQEYIQDWPDLDEGGAGFQLLTEEEIAAVIFLYIVISTTYINKFSIYLFPNFFVFSVYFSFINSDYSLIRMTSPLINLD
jgi:hypothetical protein